jgi:hypothetical protein
MGAVLSQVHRQPSGHHCGSYGDDEAASHARQHRRRHRSFAGRGDAEVPPQILDRYVGEYKATSGLIATFRRNGDALFVKVGTRPEVALVASAPIRFSDRQGSVYEFQYKDAGAPTKATGVILEQGGQKIALEKQ